MLRIVLLALLASCGGSQPVSESRQPEPEPARPDPEAEPVSPHFKARFEVKRLTTEANKNPLLTEWTGPYGGVPPWDKISAAAFPAAFATGLELLAAEIAVIAENPEPATFENTMLAYESVGRHFDRAETLFGVMTSNLNGPEVQAVDREWSPKISAAYDAITFNGKLYARLAALDAARATSKLSEEQKRLIELQHRSFVQRGAKLDSKQQEQLGKINQDLSVAFTDFKNKVLADENTWIVLEKEADLAGLPESLRASLKAAADERKLAGKWVIVNTRSSVDPFLEVSSRRDLREKVWKQFKNRGDNGGENDTNKLIAQIVKLRADRAKLLGYPSHAHWRMANTMAVDPKKAEELMMRVWPGAVARVKEEVADMQKIANRDRVKAIEPWDYLFYAEKVRKAKYALDQDELKSYFELGNMIKGSFYMAEQLYGLKFEEITGKVPVFHPDVRVWEVKSADGKYAGLFYGDYFARAGKRSGAWKTDYQGHETFTGTVRKSIPSNNNNFVKGAQGAPVLISLDDAQTLFHEFGHALHSLLSEVNYPGLRNTPRDFVEYPSQVHEMWVLTRPILDKFGLHYKTGKPMPQKLIDKVEATKRFNQGYATVEFLASAILDMKLHVKPDGVVDADAFERTTLAEIGNPKQVAMRHRLPHFTHLFTSDSYSAGYYSYLWAEVMDADTREAFIEAKNVFDKTTADKLRKYILAPGNSTDRTEAYRQFRGRDPDVKALLKKRGFPTK